MLSLFLLFLFPCLVVGLLFLACFLFAFLTVHEESSADIFSWTLHWFASAAPWVIGGVLVWFVIAYFLNTSIINSAIGSHPLQRKENKRVYNLVENLCMSQGMKMPQVNIIEDDSLNACASGINEKTYTITLSRGIINKLDDDELETVIAHELSHIRNNDVRLLIISIVFVGIFALLAEMAMRMIYSTTRVRTSSNNKNGGGIIIVVLIALLIAAIGYLFSTLMRFAISRKREYLADAGAAEMTKKPLALASALRKISVDPNIEAITRDDVAQLFIDHPLKKKKSLFSAFTGLFATHPPIKKRIEVLEQF